MNTTDVVTGKYEQALALAESLCTLNWNDLAIEVLNRAKPLATDRDQSALIVCRLGEYYLRRGDYEQAVLHLERAIAQLAHRPDALELFHAYRDIAWVYWREGYLERAAGFVEGARAVIELREDWDDAETIKAKAAFEHLKALLAGAKGDHAAAIRYYDREIGLLEQCQCRDRLGPAYGNLCGSYRTLGDYGRALEYQTKSVEIAEDCGDLLSVGIGCNNLGEIYHNLGDNIKAESFFNRYLEINRGLGNGIGDSFALAGLGRLYAMQGGFARAESYFRRALVKAMEVKSRVREACILADMAQMYCGMGDGPQGMLHIDRAADIYQQTERPPSCWHQILKARVLCLLAQQTPECLDEAFYILEQTVAMPLMIEDEQTLSSPEIALEAYLLLTRISVAKHDQHQAREYLEKALFFIERVARNVPVELKVGFFTMPSVREALALKEQLGGGGE
jgi:tetratricopeptide (TPR) repeat protein